MYLLLFLISIVYAQEDIPCLRQLSVNITDGEKQQDNSIIKDNVVYHTRDYYVEDNATWGCLCNIKRCIRKCCIADDPDSQVCNRQNSELSISIFDETHPINDLSVQNFSFVHGKICVKDHVLIQSEPENSLYMQRNGSLYVKFEEGENTYDLGYYCFTMTEGTAQAFLCEYVDQAEAQEDQLSRLMYCTGKYFVLL